MSVEFERYGLARLRLPVASLEILGALGLLYAPSPEWTAAAALGLCALMLAALWTRIRIRDPWQAMSPAMILLFLNLWIARAALGRD